jgi:uncharacterized membrane protein
VGLAVAVVVVAVAVVVVAVAEVVAVVVAVVVVVEVTVSVAWAYAVGTSPAGMACPPPMRIALRAPSAAVPQPRVRVLMFASHAPRTAARAKLRGPRWRIHYKGTRGRCRSIARWAVDSAVLTRGEAER